MKDDANRANIYEGASSSSQPRCKERSVSRAFCGVVIADPATKTVVIDREYRAGRKASTEDVVEGKMGVPQEETGSRSLRDEKQPR